MKNRRYAVIGSGMMGHEHIRNIAYVGNTAFTVIVDPDRAMGASAAQPANEFGLCVASARASLQYPAERYDGQTPDKIDNAVAALVRNGGKSEVSGAIDVVLSMAIERTVQSGQPFEILQEFSV